MMRPQLRCLHLRQREPGRVEGRAEVDRDDRVPALDRELLDRRDVLDAGVVDEDVDAAEVGLGRVGHHRLDLGRLAHVGAVVATS